MVGELTIGCDLCERTLTFFAKKTFKASVLIGCGVRGLGQRVVGTPQHQTIDQKETTGARGRQDISVFFPPAELNWTRSVT